MTKPPRDAAGERDAWVILASADGVGPVTFARLVRVHGSAQRVVDLALRPNGLRALAAAGLRDDDSRRIPLPAATAEAIIVAARSAETLFRNVRSSGLDIMTSDDVDYPVRLLEVEWPPPVLFVRGDRAALSADHPVAVVGTRRATESGRWTARRIADAISRAGGLVVSGLALGIDGEAHDAAVDAKRPTVAVLGSGHAKLYPRAHLGLANRIVEQGGAVISELAPTVPGTQGTFPRRNRVISGLSLATVVIEAPVMSGALNTARWALEQGRECYVVPGAFGATSTAGAIDFVREYHGQARIVSTIPDLLEDLGLLNGTRSSAGRPTMPVGGVEGQVGDLVAAGVSTVDELVLRTGLAVATVLSALTLLEMRGLVVASYGRYRPHPSLLPDRTRGPRARASPAAAGGSATVPGAKPRG